MKRMKNASKVMLTVCLIAIVVFAGILILARPVDAKSRMKKIDSALGYSIYEDTCCTSARA